MIQRVAGLFMLSMMVAASTNATIIPLNNDDFENPTLGLNSTTTLNNVPSWNVTGGPDIARVFHPLADSSTHFNTGAIPSPNNVLMIDLDGVVDQANTGGFVATPFVTYILQVSVGNILNNITNGRVRLSILAGPGVLASLVVNSPAINAITDGEFQQFTLSYKVLPGNTLIGGLIGARLEALGGGDSVYLDNVVLSSVLPEPGTWALMAVASVFGTGYLVKRRRKSLVA